MTTATYIVDNDFVDDDFDYYPDNIVLSPSSGVVTVVLALAHPIILFCFFARHGASQVLCGHAPWSSRSYSTTSCLRVDEDSGDAPASCSLACS